MASHFNRKQFDPLQSNFRMNGTTSSKRKKESNTSGWSRGMLRCTITISGDNRHCRLRYILALIFTPQPREIPPNAALTLRCLYPIFARAHHHRRQANNARRSRIAHFGPIDDDKGEPQKPINFNFSLFLHFLLSFAALNILNLDYILCMGIERWNIWDAGVSLYPSHEKSLLTFQWADLHI